MALPSSDPKAPGPQGPEPSRDTPVTGSTIEGLRARLSGARAQRGACPPLAALQRDALPAREPAPGWEERRKHLERCLVCSHRMHAWRNSWEGRGALLLALARLTSGRLARGARRALSATAKNLPRRPRPARGALDELVGESVGARSEASRSGPKLLAPAAPPVPGAAPRGPSLPAARPAAAPPDRQPPRAEGPPAPPPRLPGSVTSDYWSSAPTAEAPPRASGRPTRPVRQARLANPFRHETLPPILVFEAPPPGVTPRALIDAVVARGGAVVSVESVEEIFSDPDFASVRAIILTRARPLAEWPMSIQRVRERAPGRAVLAVVPVPRFGASAVTWSRDSAVLLPPVSEKDWSPALHRAGWLAPA